MSRLRESPLKWTRCELNGAAGLWHLLGTSGHRGLSIQHDARVRGRRGRVRGAFGLKRFQT